MKVKLTKDQRLWHKEGEVLEVTEEVAVMLLTSGSAEKVEKTEKKKK